MSSRLQLRLMLITMLVVLLAACASDDADPAETVERYLQAKVEADTDSLRGLLCSAMEGELEREARTFATVSDVTIEDMSCARIDGQDAVSCDGEIIAVYGAEDTSFPLGTYAVTQEDGEWKYCGETD